MTSCFNTHVHVFARPTLAFLASKYPGVTGSQTSMFLQEIVQLLPKAALPCHPPTSHVWKLWVSTPSPTLVLSVFVILAETLSVTSILSLWGAILIYLLLCSFTFIAKTTTYGSLPLSPCSAQVPGCWVQTPTGMGHLSASQLSSYCYFHRLCGQTDVRTFLLSQNYNYVAA